MKPHSLLIVDDEQEVLNSLSIVLKDEYNVLTASSGMEGLSVLTANAVSLILLDLQMPEMTGLEFIERIRGMEDNTPVLIMTGNSTHEWAKRCADIGVQGYLEKPVDIGVLLERVRKHLAEKTRPAQDVMERRIQIKNRLAEPKYQEGPGLPPEKHPSRHIERGTGCPSQYVP